jgi:hypothetical protein
MRSSSDLVRYVFLGLVVVLEGLAVLSAVLHIAFLPFPTVYPELDSLLVLLLPLIVGFMSQRLEVAIMLAVGPFVVLALVYAVVYAPVWQIDLVQLGVLASRVAGMLYLLGGLGAIGWLVRRVFGLPTALSLKPR